MLACEFSAQYVSNVIYPSGRNNVQGVIDKDSVDFCTESLIKQFQWRDPNTRSEQNVVIYANTAHIDEDN